MDVPERGLSVARFLCSCLIVWLMPCFIGLYLHTNTMALRPAEHLGSIPCVRTPVEGHGANQGSSLGATWCEHVRAGP